MASQEVLKALAITSQIYGRDFSPEAAQVLAIDLEEYPEQAVLKALSRCRRELRTFPTLADIIARIDDGRPGAEEAWAMIPKDEYGSVVWTGEMAEAFGVARRLVEEDAIAARMTFKEIYSRLVTQAREAHRPVKWEPSLGLDRNARSAALVEAANAGRIALADYSHEMPQLEHKPQRLMIESDAAVEEMPMQDFRAMMSQIKERIGRGAEQ